MEPSPMSTNILDICLLHIPPSKLIQFLLQHNTHHSTKFSYDMITASNPLPDVEYESFLLKLLELYPNIILKGVILRYLSSIQPSVDLIILHPQQHNLRNLSIEGNIKNINILQQCINLQYLKIIPYTSSIDDLSFLKYCTKLQHLEIPHTTITTISFLTHIPHLKYLNLSGNESRELTDFTPIITCTQLTILILYETNITTIQFLTHLKKIKFLNLMNTQINDLSPLSNHPSLKHINISKCQSISDLTPLSSCKKLQILIMNLCKLISTLNPFSNNASITTIYMSKCKNILTLEPLKTCQKLTTLGLGKQHILFDPTYFDKSHGQNKVRIL